MVEKRLDLLRKRLSKDKDLHEKYFSAIQDYLTKGYAEKVPENELDKGAASVVPTPPPYNAPHEAW